MAVVGIGTILLYDILTAKVRYRTAVSIAIVILLFAALLQADRGVVDTEVGYANGTADNPTYNDVFAQEQKHIQGKIAVENLPLKYGSFI